MTNDRVILHCDLNSFFVSVELLFYPELKNRCVAVGGSEASRHGIILAKNENAKKYGVKTGETLRSAREKCPWLTVIPPHFDRYMYYSEKVRDIYLRYTDIVESFGIDECWLDITGSLFLFGTPLEIADKIRKSVRNETGLTVSVGVSFNKTFAKLASDLKKPNAVTVIMKKDVKEKVFPLPCDFLFGIGGSTGEKLKQRGIYTIGDLAFAPLEFVSDILGKNGAAMIKCARGEDDAPVTYENFTPQIKSISHGCTSSFDLCNEQAVILLIKYLSESVAKRMRALKLAAHGIRVFIRDSTFNEFSLSERAEIPIYSSHQICSAAIGLIKDKISFKKPIRAVSVAVTYLSDEKEPFQIEFGYDIQKLNKTIAAENAVDVIRNKMGTGAIVRASLMNVRFSKTSEIYEYNPFGNKLKNA